MHVFKILTPPEWAAMAEAGLFAGSAADRADGFIHLSTAEQLPGTLERHYAEAAELVLLTVETDVLAGAELRWEPARGGALFPHLYAALPMRAVRARHALRRDEAGNFVLPEALAGG